VGTLDCGRLRPELRPDAAWGADLERLRWGNPYADGQVMSDEVGYSLSPLRRRFGVAAAQPIDPQCPERAGATLGQGFSVAPDLRVRRHSSAGTSALDSEVQRCNCSRYHGNLIASTLSASDAVGGADVSPPDNGRSTMGGRMCVPERAHRLWCRAQGGARGISASSVERVVFRPPACRPARAQAVAAAQPMGATSQLKLASAL